VDCLGFGLGSTVRDSGFVKQNRVRHPVQLSMMRWNRNGLSIRSLRGEQRLRWNNEKSDFRS
jgi:hypothetical protein